MIIAGRVLQVNVGPAQTVQINGRDVSTAIVKSAVEGPVHVHVDHVEGDTQANTEHHGGPWQAVYAFDRATADHFGALHDKDLPNAFFGENLTLEGVDCDNPVIGQQWRIGDELVVAVTAPRIPCKKLGWRMQQPGFVKEFMAADRTGTYLRVVQEGPVQAGDTVEVVSTPDHGVTIVDLLAMWRGDASKAALVLSAGDDLAPESRARAESLQARVDA